MVTFHSYIMLNYQRVTSIHGNTLETNNDSSVYHHYRSNMRHTPCLDQPTCGHDELITLGGGTSKRIASPNKMKSKILLKYRGKTHLCGGKTHLSSFLVVSTRKMINWDQHPKYGYYGFEKQMKRIITLGASCQHTFQTCSNHILSAGA